MTLPEKVLYHQIHPAKLATDWAPPRLRFTCCGSIASDGRWL
jgi:hypothetical protein